jgi:hypothetical protein
MAKRAKTVLTLDRPVTYQIKVPGELDADWAGGITVTVKRDDEIGSPVSTLTGVFDQAALQGFLRRLYSYGLPLISIKWINTNDKNQGNLD